MNTLTTLKEYDGKKLKNCSKEGLELDGEEEKKALEEAKAEYDDRAVFVMGIFGILWFFPWFVFC